jgi:hypothetical protein
MSADLERIDMSKLKTLTIPNHYQVDAKATLQEAMDETPDTVIVLCFWKDRGQFKIKTSAVQDRLMLIGALEESKNKIITDGYTS